MFNSSLLVVFDLIFELLQVSNGRFKELTNLITSSRFCSRLRTSYSKALELPESIDLPLLWVIKDRSEFMNTTPFSRSQRSKTNLGISPSRLLIVDKLHEDF